jgi:hypothetical protein
MSLAFLMGFYYKIICIFLEHSQKTRHTQAEDLRLQGRRTKMQHKLLRVLASLSDEEFKRLTRFVNSPYFNRDQPQRRLLKILADFRKNSKQTTGIRTTAQPPFIKGDSKKTTPQPAFIKGDWKKTTPQPTFIKGDLKATTHSALRASLQGGDFPPSLTREILWAKVYPHKEYNYSTMRSLLADLTNTLQDFLVEEKFRVDEERRNLYLLKGLSDHGLEEIYRSCMRRIETEMSRNGQADANRYLLLHELEENIADFKIIHDRTLHKDSLASRIKAIEQIYIYLSLSHFLKLVEGMYKLWLQSQKYNLIFERTGIRELIETVDIKKLRNFFETKTKFGPIVEVYVSLIEMLGDISNQNKYFAYKRNVMKNLPRMSSNERIFHSANLINYCNLENNYSSTEYNFKKELFELYEQMLLKQYYKNSEDKYLNPSLFRNMLLLALSLEKIKWAKNFVSHYNSHLPPKYRKDMLNYGQAMIAIEEHELNAAMNLISKVKEPSFIFKYDMKALELRVYIENGETENARCHIRRCLQFLTEDEFRKNEDKEYYRTFFKCCRKLLRNKTDELEFYRDKIMRTRKVACRRWLLERMDEMLQHAKWKAPSARAVQRMESLGVALYRERESS